MYLVQHIYYLILEYQYINLLFIKKLREIYSFILKNNSQLTNNSSNNTIVTTNEDKRSRVCSASATPNITPKAITKSENLQKSDIEFIDNGRGYGESTSNRTINLIFSLAIRCSILMTIIAVSSLSVLIFTSIRVMIVMFNNGNEILFLIPIQFLLGTIDSMINMICLIGYFEFAAKYRKIWSMLFCGKYCNCAQKCIKRLL